MKNLHTKLERTSIKLDALNPSGVLERGYACVSTGGHILSSVSELNAEEMVNIRFRDGSASAQIRTIEKMVMSDGQ